MRFLHFIICALFPCVVSAQVLPLLGDEWRDQGEPFNKYCPDYDNQGKRCMTGCVAVAAEQIMSYYRRTYTLSDTLHGWKNDHYEIADILPGESVDASLIRPRYDEGQYTEKEVDAVAKLTYWLGVACHMAYGLDSSGASVSKLVSPLQNAFKMGTVKHLYVENYTLDDWKNIIISELKAGRPVYYAGYTMFMSGHAFVIDGVDENGNFHVNWGYGDCYNGYFPLESLHYCEPLNDSREDNQTEGFYCNQEMLLLHPDDKEIVLPDTLIRTGKEIVIDSLVIEKDLIAGKQSPARVYVRNVSDKALMQTFAVFTNETTRTDSLYEKGDYGAIFGARLKPGESDTLHLNLNFSDVGSRILRVTPDDSTTVCEMPVEILAAQTATLTFSEPEIKFSDDGTRISVSTDVTNSGIQRAGQRLVFCVSESTDFDKDECAMHTRYLHTEAGVTETQTMEFRALKPGGKYYLMLRSPWKAVSGIIPFEMPVPEGIENQKVNRQSDEFYDLQGRRVNKNPIRGVQVKNGRKMLK